MRLTPEPEVQALLKAIQVRIDGIRMVTGELRDGHWVYLCDAIPFLQIEVRRDHMSLDLWLPPPLQEEARSSGIARSHPFLGADAVKVRFERAADLAKVARWVEASSSYSRERPLHPPEPAPVPPPVPTPSVAPPAPAPSPTPPVAAAPQPAPAAVPEAKPVTQAAAELKAGPRKVARTSKKKKVAAKTKAAAVKKSATKKRGQKRTTLPRKSGR